MAFKYEEYLLSELNIAKASLGFDDYTIKITSERSFRMPVKPNGKLLFFIIKNLTGSYVFNIKTQPVQIICYSEINAMTVGMQILDLFTKEHNNKSQLIDSQLIKQDYDTVVTLRPMLPTEAGFKASLYCYGSYVICDGIADVTDLKWWDDSLTTPAYVSFAYITLGVGYSAVLNTTKESGKELSTSMKQEAGLIISMSIMNDNSNFCKAVNNVMLGSSSGNTSFKFSFTLNGVTFTSNNEFVLSQASLTTNRTDAPALQLTFTR